MRSRHYLLAVIAVAAALAFGAPPAPAHEAATPMVGSTVQTEPGVARGDTLFVTREGIIAAALANNEMLAAAGAMSDAAAAEALGAWRGFLPRVSLGAYRIRSNDPLYSFGFKLNQRIATQADFNPDLLNNPGPSENNIMQVRAEMPLFNAGMSVYGKKAANAASRAAEADHERAAETIEFHAVQAYEGLVLAHSWVRVMKDALAAADGHVRQARAMYEAEMVTEADLLQARVRRSSLAQRLIEVRNMADIATENIKLLTAVDTPLPMAPAGAEDPPVDPEIPEVDSGAAEYRSDIQAHGERTAAASNMVKVARGRLLPHLNMSAEKNFFSRDEFLRNDSSTWTVGLYATWDIFSGLENIGGLKKARAESRAASHMLDFEKRRARMEAVQAHLGLRAAAEKVSVARDAVAAAREGLRIVENQYREGLASMVDLLDVQAAATMAEGDLVQARYDYMVSLAELRYSAGAVGAATIEE